MLIYMATNQISGKSYVGQTIRTLKQRKSEHTNDTLNGNRDNSYFHNAIQKYSPDNFTWTILHDDITTIEDLNRLEVYYIQLYDTFDCGYNLNIGGRNALVSDESKRKMSESTRGKNHPMYGKHHSKESRRRMSKAQKGKIVSEKTKQRMSENHANVSGSNHPRARAVIINGRYFDTVRLVAQFLSVVPATILYRIKHKTKWQDYSYV